MDENWERRIIEQLATEGLLEQQRARRWGIFFKLLTFAFLDSIGLGGAGWVVLQRWHIRSGTS